MSADNPSACAWCELPAHIRQGRLMLCQRHYRFSTMRAGAKRNDKTVPSRSQLEALVPVPFTCGSCRRPMNWLQRDGASTQATLQHDRSGGLRILCLACNTRHAQHPGDSFYSIPSGHKRCPDCEGVKPLAAFCADQSRPIGRKSYCRPCAAKRYKKWSTAHAA